MAVMADDLSDTENVVSLKGLCMSYLDNGIVCACALLGELYVYVYVRPKIFLKALPCIY